MNDYIRKLFKMLILFSLFRRERHLSFFRKSFDVSFDHIIGQFILCNNLYNNLSSWTNIKKFLAVWQIPSTKNIPWLVPPWSDSMMILINNYYAFILLFKSGLHLVTIFFCSLVYCKTFELCLQFVSYKHVLDLLRMGCYTASLLEKLECYFTYSEAWIS